MAEEKPNFTIGETLFSTFEDALNKKPHLLIEVGYNRVTDWTVTVWDATEVSIKNAAEIIRTQDVSREEACRQAIARLKDLIMIDDKTTLELKQRREENNMSINPFTDQALLKKTCEQLGLGDGFAITYAATRVSLILDTDDVTQALDDTSIRISEVESAVENALVSIKLPKGLMLVGVEKTECSEEDRPRYTLVTVDEVE